jgi:organic radical activating enzyme
MKERFRIWYDRIFPRIEHLPSGIFHYQTPSENEQQYRLHLRLEETGEGTLIINAKTVLHLNRTAAEYAFYMVKGLSSEDAARNVKARYRISLLQARQDYDNFSEQIYTLIHTPDLAPDVYLDFDRVDPYSRNIIAPYRLDCAITYKTGETGKKSAPSDRVKRELTTEEWKTILSKAWNAGIPHIIFTGGEPTLRPDLPDLIIEAEKLGQVSGIITDGKRLSETKYLHELLKAGLDHVMIILDTEVESSWEAVRDIISEDIFLNVHLTLTRQNAQVMAKTIDKLITIGVKSFSLSTDNIALKENLNELKNVITGKGASIIWDLPVPYSHLHPVEMELIEHEHPSQGAGKAWLYVEPDGDVLPEQGENKVLGNFLSDNWEKIWQNASKK